MASFARTALRLAVRSRIVAPRVPLARGFAVSRPAAEILKRYTNDHEWITLDTEDPNHIATMGITTYAAEALGDVVYVELPELASSAVAGEPFGAVESVKSASDILAPASGEVVEINVVLNDKPGVINASPEGDGWIAKIKVEGREAIEAGEGLMGEKEYLEYTEH